MMFRIPTITKNLLIINLIAFLATIVLPVPTGDLSFPPRQFHAYPE